MLDTPPFQLSDRAALLFDCDARVDVLESITHFFAQRHLSIHSAQQFTIEDRFYLRLEWWLDDCWENEEAFSKSFAASSEHFEGEFVVKFFNRKQSMGLFVAEGDHCLKAVLNLWQIDYFGALDILFIVGDDDSARHFADRHAVPFFEVPVDALQREKEQLDIVRRYSPELIGLTAGVQPLSAHFLNQIEAIAFDVHRSFLVAGDHRLSLAALYRQGFKLVGASSRAVSADIDTGQIIEQAAQRLSEVADLAQFTESVHQIEQKVFCQALIKLIQHKVLLSKKRCMVFA